MNFEPEPGSLRHYLYALIALALACLLAYVLLSIAREDARGGYYEQMMERLKEQNK